MPGLDQPFQLLPLFRERVWGRTSLAPFFPNSSGPEPIGEVWFTVDDNQTSLGPTLGTLLAENSSILGSGADPRHPGICPILVKFLFTTSRLSVQVHPDDKYAAEHHQSLGKTEAWYVLATEPPAEVAVGFKEEITPERLRESATTGEIEELLDWRTSKPGDIIFTPAGTVHAIGAGMTICEIQQNSDITYRLYDYGRPRELHLDHGCKISRLGPHDHASSAVTVETWREDLVSCEYFRIERLHSAPTLGFDSNLPHYILLICIAGSGTIAGQPFAAGQTWMVPARSQPFQVEGRGSEWILTYAAEAPLSGIRA